MKIWTENRYEKSRKGRSFHYDGSIDGKKREEEELYLEADWCGKLYISLEQKQVYDYLSLFRSRIREDQEEEIAVLPSSQPLTVIFSEADTWEKQDQGDRIPRSKRSPGGEIRQLREYAPGDLLRGIHWKQSARTDKLLVKEFQREEEEEVSLYLEGAAVTGILRIQWKIWIISLPLSSIPSRVILPTPGCRECFLLTKIL